METFKGKINEFIDWTTGVNELTGNKIQGVSDQTPISGQSIRELLLSRLKTPFVKYDDPKHGQYIFFSSEDARDEWLRLTNTESPSYSEESAELATRLPITTMPRPADTVIVVRPVLDNGEEVSSDTAIGNSRYILSDDSSSSEADIRYTVRMFKEAGGSQLATVDSFSVTYTITDANGGKYTSVENYDSDKVTSGDELKVLSFNCFSHITEGANNVSLHVASKNSGAVFDIEIPVYLVRFTISSTFDFSGAIQQGSTFRIPYSVNRSVSGMTLEVKAEICDGSAVNKVFTQVSDFSTTNPDNPYTDYLDIVNNFPANSDSSDHILHTLLLYATLTKSGSSVNGFTSNTLVYNFETASLTSNLVNKFINIKYDAPANKLIKSNGAITLYAIQYEPFSLGWAYYTDHSNFESNIDVSWYLKYKDGQEYKYMLVGGGSGDRLRISDPLRFIPSVYQTEEDHAKLIARRTDNGLDLGEFPIIIAKSTYDVQEVSDVKFKISAFGKSNLQNDRDEWVDYVSGENKATFTNIPFDNGCGWDSDSLIMLGSGRLVLINYTPIEMDGAFRTLGNTGKTIEIEFTPTKSNNDDDVLVRIGDPLKGHIDIKPNGAFLYLGNSTNDVVHTNYKVGERIKLAFVFNITDSYIKESNLVYIINNGILERAASIGTPSEYGSDNGKIIIGGTDSGVRVYNMRIYDKALTPMQELNNYIYDSSDKPTIISRNLIYKGGRLDFNLVKNKIDTILIEGLSGLNPEEKEYGGLTKILSNSGNKEGSETTVNIKRTCVSDDTKSFYILKALIRKHGQSTLNYPITSLKFWLNKSANVETADTPVFVDLSDTLLVLNLNKNRYIMKAGAIPANKFVLLANYADSSGTHNGSLLRLIQDTWYRALFSNDNYEYKLRTAPQLFTSDKIVIHNNPYLHENDDPWTDGYGVNLAANKTWKGLTGKDFPYTIRNSADSFPCAVFYKDPNEDEYEHFLGQYVFMDDKKSDFIYGERSIYAFGDYTDPFVMNTDNTKNGKNGRLDVDENKVWDNSNVLRIEVVLPNTNITSYMGMRVPTTITLDDEGNIINASGNMVDCTDIKYDDKGKALKFYWEDYFEMIYPDPDDVEYEKINKVDVYTKFEEDSKFRRTALPFIDFLTWITGIAKDNVHTVDGESKPYIDGTVKSEVLTRFINEAHLHLDLYKLAAYYIFFLRFGLVDSVERNAQLKTYDGQHWHYEPWDMDIALGNTNQGALVFNPPLDRNSVIPGTPTKAFTGRGESTSNFLWDCLEAWDDWMNKIVPDVAEALYNAGLTYDNAIKIFDGEYSDKWSESLYNDAGYFKYIQHGGKDWVPWLQGSRASHRHWWLSTSMNYYDSKWACGTFKEKHVVLFVDKGIHNTGTDIVTIKPTANTYFEITSNTGTTSIEKKSASPTNPAAFDISPNSFSAKDPTWIYGGLFIEELDLSCFAQTMASVDVSLCYDKVLGANIKYLNIGVPTSDVSSNEKSGTIAGTKLRLSAVDPYTRTDALERLTTLNITGQSTITDTSSILTQNDRSSIRNIYAAGTSIGSFENASSGNTFDDLILPSKTEITNADNTVTSTEIRSFIMHSASWSNLEFWDTVATSAQTLVLDENNEPLLVDGLPVYNPASARYTKHVGIPSSIYNVLFDGSTARSEASLQFLKNWIHSIATTLDSYDPLNDTYDVDELHEALESMTFRAENIYWTDSFSTRLTYDDLENIAHLNGVRTVAGTTSFNNHNGGFIKGYVIITGGLTAEQMVNIKKWFGDSAFDKTAVRQLLVVDSASNTVVINIDNATIVDGSVHITEGTTASMLGTKFLLGDASGENYTIGQELQVTGNKLIWAIADGTNFSLQDANTLSWGSTFKSCKLQLSQSGDGRMLLVAEPGIYNDYYLAIRVTFINDQQSIDHAYLVVYIEGVTYPTGYLLNVAGSGKRVFNVDTITYLNIFGANYSTYGNLSVPTYVLHTANQLMDVSIVPEGTFTAQVTQTLFNLIKILNGVGITITNGYLNIAEVNSANYTQMLTLDSSNLVGYNSNGGNLYTISIVAGPNLSSVQTCAAYLLLLLIKIGARTENRAINIVVLDDSLAVLMSSISNGTYLVLSNKYASLYGPINSRNLYKTDLIGITGTVDFTGNISNTTSLVSSLSNGDSVLKYLPNVTGLNFAGCINIQDLASIFDFSYCTKLTSLNISGCTGLSLNVLDLKECTNLQSLNTENTNIGVILGDASTNSSKKSQISTLNLGSPNKLVIDGATTLTSSGVSITSSSNLTELLIKNVNDNNVCGYTLFDTIYNPQQSNNQSS